MHSLIKSDTRELAKSERSILPLIEGFLKSQDIKESSKATYKRYLRMFAKWIDKQPRIAGENYTRENILEYKEALKDRDLTADTISNAIGAVRVFFTWAESMGYYPNIAKSVRGAKRNRTHKKDELAIDQVKALLGNIDKGTAQGLRDFAIMNLMIRAGLRTIEISRANIGDLGSRDGAEILRLQRKGKDSKDDFVVLTPATLAAIRDYLRSRDSLKESSPLFASDSNRNKNQRLTTRTISRIAKDRLKDIGIISRRITAHSCRHTAITLALLGGATIQEAQMFAGHSNINTTLIYAHNLNRVKQAPEMKIDTLLSEA